MIEDCLDIGRMQNNKFSLFKQKFDIRAAVKEVCEIMQFQIEEKGLLLLIDISNNVPHYFNKLLSQAPMIDVLVFVRYIVSELCFKDCSIKSKTF